jgi:hypothetical protein
LHRKTKRNNAKKGGVNEMTSSYEPDYDDWDYEPDYDDYDDYNADEEAWYALTDGQYGDYPGCEVDYDFMGW